MISKILEESCDRAYNLLLSNSSRSQLRTKSVTSHFIVVIEIHQKLQEVATPSESPWSSYYTVGCCGKRNVDKAAGTPL